MPSTNCCNSRRVSGSAGELLLIGVLLAATLLVYANSFPGAFHFDDFVLLLENPHVTQDSFRYASFLDHYGGRPLTLFTFYWNYKLAGQNPWSYHLVSLLLHALVVVGIFAFLLQLFHSRTLAFGAALIFAVHPLQTQAVNYIWSRSVLLTAAFGLLALILAKKHPLAALIAFQLAIWSRTEAVIFLVFVIYLNRSRWKTFSAVALANVILFVYSLRAYAPREVAWNHSDISGYWLAQPAAFWKYLRLMIWPAGLSIDHHFLIPDALAFSIAGAGILVTFLLLFRLRKSNCVACFGMVWMLTMPAPGFFLPNSDLFNESRAYLALAGFALIASWTFLEISKFKNALATAAWVLVISLWGLATVRRNEIWKDDVSLWEHAALQSPGKARVHYNLGAALTRRGDFRRAEKEFSVARNLNPKDDFSYAALGYCAEKQREWGRARQLYEQALRLNPQNMYAKRARERIEVH